MDTLLILLAIIVFVSIIAFVVGLVIVIFYKENRAYGIKLLTYSTIVALIGFGTCAGILSRGGF